MESPMESPMELRLHVSIISFVYEEKLFFQQHVAGSLIWL
jgi:hypothetical protein